VKRQGAANLKWLHIAELLLKSALIDLDPMKKHQGRASFKIGAALALSVVKRTTTLQVRYFIWHKHKAKYAKMPHVHLLRSNM